MWLTHGKKGFVPVATLLMGVVGLGAALAIVGVATGWFASSPAPSEPPSTQSGEEEVWVPGTIEASKLLSLALSRGGRVVQVRGVAGQEVAEGDILIELDRTTASAELDEATAKLSSARRVLETLLQGVPPGAEGIPAKEASLEKAKQNLATAMSAVPGIVAAAYASADDAVRAKTDKLFEDDDSDTPRLSFPVRDSQVEADAVRGRVAARLALRAWQEERTAMGSGTSSSRLVTARTHLVALDTFLEDALDAVAMSVGLSASSTVAHQKNIAAARANVAKSIEKVDAQSQKIETQFASVARAEQELLQKQMKPTETQRIAQEEKVKALEEGVKKYRARLAELSLRAPVAGSITEQRARVGELVEAKETVVTLMPRGSLQVVVAVPGAFSGKLSAGGRAEVMLDSWKAGESIAGTVSAVVAADSATSTAGVRRATIQLPDDARLQAGMSVRVRFLSVSDVETLTE